MLGKVVTIRWSSLTTVYLKTKKKKTKNFKARLLLMVLTGDIQPMAD